MVAKDKRMRLATVTAVVLSTPSLAQSKIETGTYATHLPAACGRGRRVLLKLFTDNSYLFVQRYLCKPWSPARTRTGSWHLDGEDVVLSDESDEMRFSPMQGGCSTSVTVTDTSDFFSSRRNNRVVLNHLLSAARRRSSRNQLSHRSVSAAKRS